MRLRDIRRRRENEAAQMIPIQSESATPDNSDLLPLLDKAVNHLGTTDRQVVLMHYFQGTPLSDVGETLGLSHEAARKRLTRAVAKLRTFFVHRGIQVGPAAIVTCITHHAVQRA